MFSPKNILVTGGAGFIGSNFIHYLFKKSDFKGRLVNVDVLTYAGNLENLAGIDRDWGSGSAGRYVFERADICDAARMADILDRYQIDTVIHFAAESHVDRAILGPEEFVRTNVMGTFTLLEAAKKTWQSRESEDVLFHYISSDEVYGTLGKMGYFYETTPYRPRSPYSASKAAAAHLVKAYSHTYGLPVTISNCSNNYGPFQFPEKLIPLMVTQAMAGKPLPIYGEGANVRDWLYVEDHCRAIWAIVQHGRRGQEYNVGGNAEKTNLEVVAAICKTLERLYPIKDNPALKRSAPGIGAYKDLVTFVKDRPGHDFRYALNCDKIEKELGWQPEVSFAQGLERTVRWYIDQPEWLRNVASGEYKSWLEKNYGDR